MGLIELLRSNAEFVADGVEPLAADAQTDLLVIADSGPALGGMLEMALGLEPGAAVVVQINGAWGGRDGEELMRSVVHGLHVHGCREIVVVGCDASALRIARDRLRETTLRLGIASDSPDGIRLRDLARGPSNPRAGMLDTVRLLRNSPLVPSEVPVHGCMLERKTGLLKVLEQDQSTRTAASKTSAQPSQVDSIPDIPLPDLPDILLPEIPDLEMLGQVPEAAEKKKKKKRKRPYGQKGGGAVSIDEIQKMAPAELARAEFEPSSFAPMTITTAEVDFQIPETAPIQDTGLGSIDGMMPGQPDLIPEWEEQDLQAKQDVSAIQDVAAIRDVTAKADVSARPESKSKSSRRKTSQARKPKPPPSRNPERPMVTPIVGQAQPPKPPPKQKSKPKQQAKPAGTRVDIQAGYVAKDGAEFPLDPELQRALLKISRFLTTEFASVDRNQILGRIRRSAKQGQQTGELLKLMIGPVLKLGKKRYAVINELLKIKEELPRQAPDVALAILAEILTGA